ncbi:MAG: aminopeptidase P family protein [Candidatus Latescibacteria bacterium]|nr:aminopeptidase P family protein [Candidatus Latescibacterota bacterium]
MPSRRERLFAALDRIGADAFVATQRPNQLYLLDHPDPSIVISRPNCNFILFTAKETIVFPGIWISNACRDLLPNGEVVTNQPGDPPAGVQLAARLKKMPLKKIAFDRLGPDLADLLNRETSGLQAVQDDIATEIRRTKDERDLKGMREAARVSDLGMLAAFRAIRPGVTNGDLAAEGAAAMLRAGAEHVIMHVMTGPGTFYLDSGEDARRTIQAGEMVFIDMGIAVHGYIGDQTRAGIVGEGTPQQRDLLRTVQNAYRLASQAMKPEASTTAIYQSVIDLYAQKGWAAYFCHHVSHGLGLGGDPPRIARDAPDDRLRAGDALSCEPGVYVPGLGGARVENMIYVSESGPEELTKCPLEPPMGF